MRLVFINNAHPETPHVSGMRLHRFACAMAQRGHRVVLLTGAPPEGRFANGSVVELPDRMARHDWSKPMIVEVAPERMRALEAVRHDRAPTVLRRALTAWHFLVHGGVFADWTRPAKTVAKCIARQFKPDLVWATFGNTSNLALAQWIARRAGCPWIMDVKDNWTAFVPSGLRRLMARRFGDAAGMTSNAIHHCAIAERWLRTAKSRVIYSGVAEAFYAARAKGPTVGEEFHVLLIGSTYSEAILHRFLSTLKCWVDKLDLQQREKFRFHYAGSDSERVSTAVRTIGLADISSIHGQIPVHDLAGQVRNAGVTCYLWSQHSFHHKLLELLVVGSPVIAFPGEHAESLALAAQCDTPFFVCNGSEELKLALRQVWTAAPLLDKAQSGAPDWRWQDFAVKLESFFFDVTGRAKQICAE